MHCPVCKNVTLTMSERQGIEIDYCPECRGVWLDRGELDKIIERAAAASPNPPDGAPAAHSGQAVPARSERDPGYYPHKKKRREGFLSELFDFD
jgi:hypothetical protein